MNSRKRLKTRFSLLTLLAIAPLLPSCSTCPFAPQSTAWGAPGQVQHIVLFWLKDPTDGATATRVIETSKTFRAIPGVTGLKIGRSLPSDRPVVDDSFDIALFIGFEDADALAAYIDHPTHAEAVKDTLKPAVRKILVYDFTEE